MCLTLYRVHLQSAGGQDCADQLRCSLWWSCIRKFSSSSALWTSEFLQSILTQFLSNLSHYVVVDGYWSNMVNIVLGVPQVSVLDQPLFLLYNSGLFSLLKKVYGYTDDSIVMQSSFDRVAVAESLNSDLNKVGEWCDLWEIRLNANKRLRPRWSKGHAHCLTSCPH